jgi:hypothetical protein
MTSAQRPALPAAGGTRLALETDKNQSHEKCHFGGENPAVRVHAVLGAFFRNTPLAACNDGYFVSCVDKYSSGTLSNSTG